MNDTDEEIIRIRPGEPGYEEAQQDLVDSLPDNRPISLAEMLNMVNNNIEMFEREKIKFDFNPDVEDAFDPAGDFLARQRKLKIELEQAIAEAEAKEPGSSQPPIPTEEEKEFYSVSISDSQ